MIRKASEQLTRKLYVLFPHLQTEEGPEMNGKRLGKVEGKKGKQKKVIKFTSKFNYKLLNLIWQCGGSKILK